MTPPDDQADPPSDRRAQLPAVISPGALTGPMDAYAAALVPALIAPPAPPPAGVMSNSSPPTSATPTHGAPMRGHAPGSLPGATAAA
jgi:hypothetical protein